MGSLVAAATLIGTGMFGRAAYDAYTTIQDKNAQGLTRNQQTSADVFVLINAAGLSSSLSPSTEQYAIEHSARPVVAVIIAEQNQQKLGFNMEKTRLMINLDVTRHRLDNDKNLTTDESRQAYIDATALWSLNDNAIVLAATATGIIKPDAVLMEQLGKDVEKNPEDYGVKTPTTQETGRFLSAAKYIAPFQDEIKNFVRQQKAVRHEREAKQVEHTGP